MSEISSIDLRERENSVSSTSSLSKIKKHLHNVKKQWGPCLAAKTSWDDEYNFPAGRWAGQGIHGVAKTQH